jgi:CHAT domain-containing protein
VGTLAAAAAVIVVLFAPSLVRPWLDGDAGLVNLVGVGEQRSVLGRLTGGFPHTPPGEPSAGGQGGRAAEADRILLTTAKIRESFGERETPSRLHDLGVSQLLAGQLDASAGALLAASREQPANARYLNDVAAVQLERARRGLRPDDLPRALTSADRARRLDPSLKEAWFNRALAMSALSLGDQAKTAWNEYLARDASSAWSAEARSRLDELSKPTPADAWTRVAGRLSGPVDATLADEAVRTQTTEARNFIEGVLLPGWAAAAAGGADTAAHLDRLRIFADAMLRVSGDAFYRDSVDAIERAQAGGYSGALAAAHQHYANAAAVFADDRFADATPLLAAASAELAAAKSPFTLRASLDLSAALYFRGQAAEAIQLLDAIHAAAQDGYANLNARVSWQQGLLAFGQSRLGDAQLHYEATLAAFTRMGDAEQEATAHSLLAALYFYLGDETSEWRHRLLAFKGLEVSASPRFRHAILGSTAAALRSQNPETSILIQGAVLANAAQWGRASASAEAFAQRGSAYLALGRYLEAKQDVTASRQALAQVSDEQFRNRLEVALLATESDLFRQSEPAQAAAAASRAIEIVSLRRDRLRLAQLNLRLAKANIALGRTEQANAALERGIKAFEDERASISDEGRISALDESWQLFETGVQLAIKSGDYPRAFAMSERARARTLAEAKSAAPLRSLGEVEQGLDPREAIVALSQFDDELAVWLIRREGTIVLSRPMTRQNARRLVERQQDEIQHEAARPGASAQLYNEILRPLATKLEGVSRLVVVPDASYENVAFSALWNAHKGRFLVEERALRVSSTVSAVSTRTTERPAGINDVLIVAGPDGEPDAQLRNIAATYRSSDVLTGASATGARMFAETPRSTIVHLAARTSNNRAYPLLSRIKLADEPGRPHSGAVLARDVAARQLPQTRLIVIDGSRVDGANQHQGAMGLTRAFLAAGVPAVLGTLPGADETATRLLMVDLHKLMSSGMPADEALNTLQRNVLHSNGRRLGAWCALVLYGSDR